MTRYQLGKIVSWAGVLHNRKRVQKVVHLLQAAGCPIAADYRLHYYGPYSDDVASLLNRLVQERLLVEDELPRGASGRQFAYRLDESAAASLAEYERSEEGVVEADALRPYQHRIKELLDCELGRLEYASTIVFIRQTGLKWDAAVAEACAFKHVASNIPAMIEAERLARSIID